MGTDPYKSGKITTSAYYKKRDIVGSIAVVLDMRLENRGLELISQPSRCLSKYDVHELILTTDTASVGQKVEKPIAYVAFFEVSKGGVIIAGDELTIAGKKIGTVAGFDETHYPNHLNIIIRNENIATGRELEIKLEDEVRFCKAQS